MAGITMVTMVANRDSVAILSAILIQYVILASLSFSSLQRLPLVVVLRPV